MPCYDYKCDVCNKVFKDVIQSIKDDRFETASELGGCDCQEKNGPVTRLVGSIMKMNFIGSGFYCNDYGKKFEVMKGK